MLGERALAALDELTWFLCDIAAVAAGVETFSKRFGVNSHEFRATFPLHFFFFFAPYCAFKKKTQFFTASSFGSLKEIHPDGAAAP